MKIAYCTDSICYAGGIQRVTIAKANKLALKNEVWIIVTDNKDKPVFPLSTKVHLVNCDINYFEDDWKSRFYILKGIIYKRKQHKKRLKEILNQIQPDIVISTGTSEKTFYLTCRSAPIRFLSERYIAIKITGHYMPKVYSTNSLPFWETSLIIAYTLKNMTERWYLQKKIKLSIGEKIQKWMCVSFLILLFHLVRKKLH